MPPSIRLALARRLIAALALAPAIALMPSLAVALGVSIHSVSGDGADGVLGIGETVTFELVIENDAEELVHALLIKVDGYDEPDYTRVRDYGLSYQSAQGATRVLDWVDPILGPQPGLVPLQPPHENNYHGSTNPYLYETVLFEGISLSPVQGNGQNDLGINGNPVQGGASDVHFRVTFVNVLPPGSSESHSIDLNFRMRAIGGLGNDLPTTGDTFALTIIPEPNTALLIALALGLLSGSRFVRADARASHEG